MKNILVILTVFLSLIFTNILADVSLLQDQSTNQENIDPLQDQDQDLTTNNQDKRTICGALNKCSGGSTGSPVRHVIVQPVRHQLVAYAPVVKHLGIRPIVLGSYKYSKPKIHFRLKAPIKPVFGGWSPVISSTKPAIQVVKPASHVDVVHTSPVPHVDHIHTTPAAVTAPVHVDHVHVQPGHVHVKPVHLHPIQGAHIDQVHQVNVPHGNHYDTFTHVDHIHQTAVPVAHPVVPVAPPPTVVRPSVLFEVTRPNLGVLPYGTRFPHPILREVPHIHLKPTVPVAPAVPVSPAVPVGPAIPVAPPLPISPTLPVRPAHHHHYLPAAAVLPHQYVQGIIQTPLRFPHIIPQPGVSVEYHGTRNYLPLSGAAPFLHQIPVNTVQPLPSTGFGVAAAYHHQQLPFDHPQHGFLSQQQQQQLPHDHPIQFAAGQQQLPRKISPNFLQNQIQSAQQYQEIPQGQLPLEGEQNFDQFFQSNQESFAPNSINVQDFNQNNVIQPGQTDLQIPYHLPQHPGWDGASGFQHQQSGLQEESRGFADQVFRPSPQLEPPYKK